MAAEWDPIVITGTMGHVASNTQAEVVVDSVTSTQAGTTTKVEEEELPTEVVFPSIRQVMVGDQVETINNMIGLAIESRFSTLILWYPWHKHAFCTFLPDKLTGGVSRVS